VVDDGAMNLEVIKMLLGDCGVNVAQQVHTAMNGEQAVQLVKAQRREQMYSLILMDCNMPVMDGYEATRQIIQYLEELGIQRPLIYAQTAHSEGEYFERALESGMDLVIPKPVYKH
jgi:CheY-like chemotaxis protein